METQKKDLENLARIQSQLAREDSRDLNYYERDRAADAAATRSEASVFSALMRNVYIWMTLGLGMTALTAYYVSTRLDWVGAIMSNSALLWGLFIAEIALVVILSACIHRLSFVVAGVMFAAYAILNGVTLSFIFLAYAQSTLAMTFFATAGTFGAMSLVGWFSKKDLSGMGRVLYMLLFGLIIGSIVNIFWANSTFDWILTYAGVAIFVGLTAYDTQKIKEMMREYGSERNESTMKLALMGSLTLYLDFINLFLHLLRIFGRND